MSTPLSIKKPDATDNSENQPEMADETKAQPDAPVKEGSTYSQNFA